MEKFSGYMKHAWADLTQDKRWWQPVLILSLVELIPIIGALFVLGYMLEWGKEASWGMQRPFTRQVGDAGKRLKYGFVSLVVGFVWICPLYIVLAIARAIPVIGVLLVLLCHIAIIIAGVLVNVASLRAITYERIGPGLQVGRILKMARQDMGGLVRCWGISLIGLAVLTAIALLALIPLGLAGAFALAPAFSGGDYVVPDYGYGYGNGYSNLFGYGYGFDYDLDDDMYAPGVPGSTAQMLIGILLAASPVLLVLGLVSSFVMTMFNLLALRAYGYWLGQFKPAQWGRAQDPMPFERGPVPHVPPSGGAAYAGADGPQPTVPGGTRSAAPSGAQAAAPTGWQPGAPGGAQETAPGGAQIPTAEGAWAAPGSAQPQTDTACTDAATADAASASIAPAASGQADAVPADSQQESVPETGVAPEDSVSKQTGWRSASIGGQ